MKFGRCKFSFLFSFFFFRNTKRKKKKKKYLFPLLNRPIYFCKFYYLPDDRCQLHSETSQSKAP